MRHRLATDASWLARLARRLRRDEGGNVMVYVSLAAAAILGMVGLALDGSRAMITHSEAAAAADAAALAAASQLDGAADALVRATNAAQSTPLVANSQTFAQGEADGRRVTVTGIRFLSGLPPLDSTPIDGSYETTDPAAARFVEVKTEQLTHGNTFLRAVSDSPGVNVRGVAVAGFRTVYCKVPPIMICNPGEASSAPPPIGAEVRMVTPPGSKYVPGNFGVLVPAQCPNGSADCLRDNISKVIPNVCVSESIIPDSGLSAGPLKDAFNTRFARYPNGSTIPKDSSTAPDTNVTVRFNDKPGQCTSLTTLGGSEHFPHDSPAPAYGKYGSGVWDCAHYWSANHPGVGAPQGCTSASSNPTTRYAVYQYEREKGLARAPQCNAPGVDERRVLYLAVVNCQSEGTQTGQPSKVQSFLKTFMLAPVQGSPIELDVEVIGVARSGVDNEVVKDDVQLYR